MTDKPDFKPMTPSRNEPCPCGSGKKYKRCCGVSAAPKLGVPKNLPTGSELSGLGGEGLAGLDPQMMMQFTQALQKLPKGQMQHLQNIMRKAMNGKDVAAEAAEFEKSLPPDFQTMMKAMAGMDGNRLPEIEVDTADQEKLTEEKAREIIQKAAAEGAISKENADALLASSEEPVGLVADNPSPKMESRFGKFWKGLSGKKEP